MKIISIVGARPQFIKAAVVSRALAKHRSVTELIVHTGQHYDQNMSGIFFKQMEIPEPRYNLGIGSSTHGAQTGRMIEAVEKVLQAERPDKVLIYGDTNSTLAGAIAAAKMHIPVAHVEAGLRSFNRRMPEEINRVVADHTSDRLYAPTICACQNLAKEGVPESRVLLSGDVMYDATLFYHSKALQSSNVLSELSLQPREYILATVHRAENTDDPRRLKNILEGLAEFDRMPVVIPLHPRTRALIGQSRELAEIAAKLRIIDPVGYLEMMLLEQGAALIVTDSGGVQKEAFFFGVVCVTLREETEWVELIELNCNRLVPPVSKDAVADGVRAALAIRFDCDARPYGKGTAGETIASDLAA